MGAWHNTAYRKATHIRAALLVFTASIAAMAPLFLSQHTSAATPLVDHLAYTPPTVQSIGQNTASAAIVIETQNLTNGAETMSQDATLTLTDGAAGQFSIGATSVWEAGASNKTFYYQNATPGTYTLTAAITDPLLPYGKVEATQQIIVLDTTAPTQATNGQPNAVSTKEASVPFSWDHAQDNASTPEQLTYTLRYATANAVDGAGMLVTGTDINTITNSASMSGLSDGTYYWQVKAKDQAGNSGAWSSVWSFTVDSTPPDVTINNNDLSHTGGTVQPDITTSEDSDSLTYSWVRATNSPNGGALDTSEANILQPTFVPKTAGLYRYVLTVCDSLQNCASTTFGFTWEPIPVAVAVTASGPPPSPSPPAGLVVTKFNTTDPTALGVTTAGSSAQTSSTTAPVDNDPPNQQKKIEATYTEDSSARLWWILLILALIAASYYAYRNWQLGRAKDA